MAWTDGVTRATGDLVTAADYNSYLGANGSLMDLKSHIHDGTAGQGALLPPVNLIPNGDFSRWTKRMTFMPEVFSDTSGWTAIVGSIGSVAANVLTAGTNGRWQVNAGLSVWRDVRLSASVKQVGTATTIAGLIGVGKSDGSNWATGNVVLAGFFRTAANTVTLVLYKTIAGAGTTVASQASLTWTDGHFGWIELEAQGTTYIAKLYTQGGTSAGAKSAATLLGTVSGTVGDAAVASGAIALLNDTGVGVATQWGGVSTGDGGVVVEGWGPESFDVTFSGVKGGQAIGFQEAADSGPIGKQWALRLFYPKNDRRIDIVHQTPDGSIAPSTAYTPSYYLRRIGITGTGTVATVRSSLRNSAGTDVQNADTTWTDASSTSWTRITGSLAGISTARRAAFRVIGQDGTGTWTNATFDLMCAQLEQGSAATAWRNAPEDFAPLVWRLTLTKATMPSTTSASYVEIDPRDLAMNAHLPWDAQVDVAFSGSWRNSGLNVIQANVSFAGSHVIAATGLGYMDQPVADKAIQMAMVGATNRAAGKVRIAATWMTVAGTASFTNDRTIEFVITATKGR